METHINTLKNTSDLILKEYSSLQDQNKTLLLSQQEMKKELDHLHMSLKDAKKENVVLKESSDAFRDKLYDKSLVDHLMKKNNKWYVMDELEKKNYKNTIQELYAYLEKS